MRRALAARCTMEVLQAKRLAPLFPARASHLVGVTWLLELVESL